MFNHMHAPAAGTPASASGPLLDPALTLRAPALTLREGMIAHRARVPGLITADDDPLIGPLFEGHDACHVVFGCSTAPLDEARVDLWTLFGTTMTVRRYTAYLTHPALAPIYAAFMRWDMALPYLGSLADTPRIWSRARAMIRPWDFDAWSRWADVPVEEIRATFGIRVLGPAASHATIRPRVPREALDRAP
ncbi:MAG: hypothetical protein Q8P18_32435 [Pseudomonadota bacterium]|nr:hypothetical protein [Pseudomonadota bacterium]